MMKINSSKFLKNIKNIKNIHLIPAIIIFIYLIYNINNYIFYETFIIFILFIFGYLIIKNNIFYILLIFIIINKLFLNFNKYSEGLNNCKPNPFAQSIINKAKEKTYITSRLPKSRQSLIESDGKKIEEDVINSLSDDFYNRDEDTERVDISKDCANTIDDYKAEIDRKSRPPVLETCDIINEDDLRNLGTMKFDANDS